MRYRYGLLGFLSLIGVVGLIIEEPAFYPFFAFVLFFEYFFIKPDEMFLENMRPFMSVFWLRLRAPAVWPFSGKRRNTRCARELAGALHVP